MKKTIALISLALSVSLFAQEKKEDKKWDVNNPPGPYKEIEFTTTEGTWMNLDVSPDGKDIVFDLLGDIYIMPVSGGNAKVLRSGHAFEVHPRFSSDGKKICFISDAGGGDNIWTMNRDGSNAKQITEENFRLLNNAVFTPDGNYLIARKHFTSTRSLGAGELWMYHITGGEGIQLTVKKNSQQDLGEPCVSSDGKYVYYSEDVYPGGIFQYNKNPNEQIYVIKRFDRESGTNEIVTGGGGSAFRPQISKDGKLLAFVKRVHTKTVLYIRNMETAEEWPVYDKLSKDQQEAWAIFGVYTNFNWLDASHIIIWAEGKIKNIDINTQTASDIPFSVVSKHRVYDALKFEQNPAPDTFTAKMIRHAVTSPDGKLLVFNAAGYLWKKTLPSGTPERLIKSAPAEYNNAGLEFEPSFSPDGNTLLFTTWSDEGSGAIWKLMLKENKLVKLTSEKGIYRTPRFSNDNKQIVYLKETGNNHQGFAYTVKPGIYVMPATGGKAEFITDEGEEPVFSSNNSKIYFIGYEGEGYAYKAYDLKEKKISTLFTSKYANSFLLSPDNRWVAYRDLHKLYVAPVPYTGKSIDLSANTGSVPVTKITRDAGINIHWTGDSKKVCWTLGDEYFTKEIKSLFSFVEGAPDSLPGIDTSGIKINLILASDKPKGAIVFKGARIITMKGNEVIENGVVIVDENKITYVGKGDDIKIPSTAKIIDVTGKTIMPGFVDVHAHLGTFRQGLSPQKHWPYYANLAYGVTTTHDPSSNTEMVFSQSEMVKAGNMIGPRIFSTGTILYGADGDFKAVINNYKDAYSAIYRTKAFGAFSVKSYNQPRREQRQQVIAASRKLGIMVYPEGGSTSFYNITHVLDGHTGVEHNLPVVPLFNDVIQLWAKTNVGYTPTLIVCYGAVNGEYYFYQKTNVWENKKLLTFTPRFVIDERSRHRTMIPDEEYENGHILYSRSCKKLLDAGVKVNLGAHGQIQGIGVHWELWMLSQGGMTNMEALRCATLNGASYIGMDKYIGSLEPGKLADLIILDKNPLENIRFSETVIYTMINGRLYDASTMDEIGNYNNKRTLFYWENKYGKSYPWHLHTTGNSDQEDACGIKH